jgi:drug/metabolite transporter (DMT)-like permease
MTQDRPLLGILLMLGFCLFVPFSDALAKMLGPTVSVGQLVFARLAMQVILLLPVIWIGSRPWRMRGRVLGLTALRGALQVAGIGCMFIALRHLPLADAVAIAFVMPFIMLVLGHYVLGETVGIRRISASVVGFGGTLLVIQPSFAAVGWHALWPLAVAVIFAFFMLVTRQIAKKTDPIALQAVSGAAGCVILAPALLLGWGFDLPDLRMELHSTYVLGLLLATGVLGTAAHLLMTWSLRFAPSATLAPMQYLEIPAAALIGWLFFREFPNGLALTGIAVTIGAGLYIVLREGAEARRAKSTLRAEPAPPPA